MLKENLKARDEYEFGNLGGYDKIYPLPQEDPRQQRYNEIVKAVYNNEAETQIRKAGGPKLHELNKATADLLDKSKPKPRLFPSTKSDPTAQLAVP